MTICPHWHGAFDPCPACACGENVGGLPPPDILEEDWLMSRCVQNDLWDWERDWRGRLGACSFVRSYIYFDGDYRWLEYRWEDWAELRQAAEKLRRMSVTNLCDRGEDAAMICPTCGFAVTRAWLDSAAHGVLVDSEPIKVIYRGVLVSGHLPHVCRQTHSQPQRGQER
jgi:hypothetical protein